MNTAELLAQIDAGGQKPAAPGAGRTTADLLAEIDATPSRVIAQRHHGNVQPGELLPMPGAAEVAPGAPVPGAPAPGAPGPLPGASWNPGDSVRFLPDADAQSFARESVSNLGKFAGDALDYGNELIGSTARVVGSDLLPGLVDPPSKEQNEQFSSAMWDMVLMMGGAGAGGLAAKKVAKFAKFLGRGGKNAKKAARFIKAETPHMDMSPPVPGAPEPNLFKGAGDLINPAITSGLVASGVDWLDPTPYKSTDVVVGGGAGLVAGALQGRQTLENMLLENPKWQRIMQTPSKGKAGALMGAILGLATSQGIKYTMGSINDLVDEVVAKFSDEEPSDIEGGAE